MNYSDRTTPLVVFGGTAREQSVGVWSAPFEKPLTRHVIELVVSEEPRVSLTVLQGAIVRGSWRTVDDLHESGQVPERIIIVSRDVAPPVHIGTLTTVLIVAGTDRDRFGRPKSSRCRDDELTRIVAQVRYRSPR